MKTPEVSFSQGKFPEISIDELKSSLENHKSKNFKLFELAMELVGYDHGIIETELSLVNLPSPNNATRGSLRTIDASKMRGAAAGFISSNFSKDEKAQLYEIVALGRAYYPVTDELHLPKSLSFSA